MIERLTEDGRKTHVGQFNLTSRSPTLSEVRRQNSPQLDPAAGLVTLQYTPKGDLPPLIMEEAVAISTSNSSPGERGPGLPYLRQHCGTWRADNCGKSAKPVVGSLSFSGIAGSEPFVGTHLSSSVLFPLLLRAASASYEFHSRSLPIRALVLTGARNSEISSPDMYYPRHLGLEAGSEYNMLHAIDVHKTTAIYLQC